MNGRISEEREQEIRTLVQWIMIAAQRVRSMATEMVINTLDDRDAAQRVVKKLFPYNFNDTPDGESHIIRLASILLDRDTLLGSGLQVYNLIYLANRDDLITMWFEMAALAKNDDQAKKLTLPKPDIKIIQELGIGA